ncbi:hypothetical protein GCK32_008405, partial [Trichostrongylus colubriformis]
FWKIWNSSTVPREVPIEDLKAKAETNMRWQPLFRSFLAPALRSSTVPYSPLAVGAHLRCFSSDKGDKGEQGDFHLLPAKVQRFVAEKAELMRPRGELLCSEFRTVVVPAWPNG